MSFNLTILGCSSATPTSQRHPTSHYLSIHDRHFLIDCGEGTQMQLRKFKLKFARINRIFISHLHGDHYLGLIGFLSSLHLLNCTHEVHVYCPEPLKEIIDIQFKHSDVKLRYPLIFHFLNHKKAELIFEDDKVSVESIVLNHRIPCCGFVFREKPPLLSIRKDKMDYYKILPQDILKIKKGADYKTTDGKLIKNETLTYPPAKLRSYAFCSDTCYDESLLPHIKNVSLLYHEATFMKALKTRAKETYHSTTIDAATIAKKAKVEKLIIGHFSARYKDLEPLLEESKEVFENTVLAEEGIKYEV